MNKEEIQNFIAKRVAKEIKDGDVVNLGIGMPTLVCNYIPQDINVMLQSENGFIGLTEAKDEDKIYEHGKNIVNAGCKPAGIKANGAFFDSAMSFTIIRGGHVDATVLGALQVDEKGNIANWIIPGKMVPGMGGAMDLVMGAKKVIVAMEHSAKGKPKILKKCTLPLTAANQVDLIITEMGVIEVTKAGLVLKEIAEGYKVEDIKAATEAELIIDKDLKIMDIS
ncbi:3-oxoacid CoA-transferase subunit B [Clostridium sp. PL3]|uniref:3-oxoacid CoA-transferase subunit B n=1 Tax=Clostridium thailandense TaxID=2794346 RepID=A0A949TPZ2_9CLOT|nr:3-oxoacid CoA-transferase subunit B [Clostridium thailandense]MBV7276405.1 3-oxoacid CoA-transferase subunit B [Clostridium thailandense]